MNRDEKLVSSELAAAVIEEARSRNVDHAEGIL